MAAAASTKVDIKGEQHTIGEIFSERFTFSVPPYQRQYAWKRIYFASHGGVTPYALTTQVLREEAWTPEVIERRQRELINRLRDLWRL